MKCTLNPNIKSISGRVGNVLYKTYKRPDGKTETRAYLLPRKNDGSFGYERTAPLSPKELESRGRFFNVCQAIKNLSDYEKEQYKRQWSADKYHFNGKKYATLRGYIMARLYAEAK